MQSSTIAYTTEIEAALAWHSRSACPPRASVGAAHGSHSLDPARALVYHAPDFHASQQKYELLRRAP